LAALLPLYVEIQFFSDGATKLFMEGGTSSYNDFLLYVLAKEVPYTSLLQPPAPSGRAGLLPTSCAFLSPPRALKSTFPFLVDGVDKRCFPETPPLQPVHADPFFSLNKKREVFSRRGEPSPFIQGEPPPPSLSFFPVTLNMTGRSSWG